VCPGGAYGRRRAGWPDRSAAGERLDLTAQALGVRAVLAACDAGSAVLFGVTFGCPVAVRLAARYPARTQVLVLTGGFAKMTWPGESGFEAEPAQVGECASGIAMAYELPRQGALASKITPEPHPAVTCMQHEDDWLASPVRAAVS
jgi:pimeloyl-ACP methyl ester carboxylesterase